MPTYNLTAVNIGGFPIGESDKVVIMFSEERGLSRAVAKGAKKPGTKMAGKSEALCANKLLIATGRSLDIITQAESIDTFRKLRTDLTRLTFGLYYAELTHAFGEGLEDDCQLFFHVLLHALKLQENAEAEPALLCLEFEMFLLQMLGVSPELQVCIKCREPLTEYNINAFYSDLGGIGCGKCSPSSRARARVAEASISGRREGAYDYDDSRDSEYDERGTFVTPLVWKILVHAGSNCEWLAVPDESPRRMNQLPAPALDAAHRLIQRYLEDRAGKRMRTLDLLKQI